MKFQSSRYSNLLRYGVPRYVRIYDNFGTPNESIDRYTVVFTGNFVGRNRYCHGLAMSGAPFHPQGFCQHFEYDRVIDYPKYGHLGKKIRFYQLPVDCRSVVIDNYLALWDLGCPICRDTDGNKWTHEIFNDEVRLICLNGHRFSVPDLSNFRPNSKWNSLVQIARKYEPQIIDIMKRLKKEFVSEADFRTSEIFEDDLFDCGFKWEFEVFVNGDEGIAHEMKNGDVGVSFSIMDSESYDGEVGGLNFSIDMVEWGGRILGGCTPYNFTPQVWVDMKDDKAIQERFDLLKDTILNNTYEFVQTVENA